MRDTSAADHVIEDLAALLAGELDRNSTLAVVAHVRNCEGCTAELLSVLLAASALLAAQHAQLHLHEDLLSLEPTSRSDTPGITQESARNGPPGAARPNDTTPIGESGSEDDKLPLPPLARPRRALRIRRALAVAAAVVVLLGGGVAIGTEVAPGSSAPSFPVVARAVLEPLVAPRAAGGSVTVEAEGASRTLVVHTTDLPAPGPGRFYEVWLLDPSTLKMLPMGVLGPAGTGEYAVAAPIMAGYSAVDVSLQANDGNPAHSKTSVLRAFL